MHYPATIVTVFAGQQRATHRIEELLDTMGDAPITPEPLPNLHLIQVMTAMLAAKRAFTSTTSALDTTDALLDRLYS